jgi:aspartate/methionine/tyrosine aminotransferase
MTTTIFRLAMKFFAFQGLSVTTHGCVKGLSATGFTAGFAAINMTTIAGAAKAKVLLTPATTYANQKNIHRLRA